jgi:adenine-specific DNA-methyltransferase
MQLQYLNPRQALNKAFLKVKPIRAEIAVFKSNLGEMLAGTHEGESEEFHKNLLSDFLKKTWYNPEFFVNTKGRNDLVIHTGDSDKTNVGVIIEVKSPTNRKEMPSHENLNSKAFQELLLYYLRERITLKNLDLKYLIATNLTDWFIFDALEFEKHFAQNKQLLRQFDDFENQRLAGKTTDFFYREIASPEIEKSASGIIYTWFDISTYKPALDENDPLKDKNLIPLFKLLSPEHLLKRPFANDSNTLNQNFYRELLHVLGLKDAKKGGKHVIERNPEKERFSGSLLENTILQLDSLDKIGRLTDSEPYGKTHQEKLFNVALELCITWTNRILFLKLLEAQLVAYHSTPEAADKSHEFLNLNKIKNYDSLNSLFFQVLARRHEDRNGDVKTFFNKVPYLNSSLFEPSEPEHLTLFISNLEDEKTMPVYHQTVLKDSRGKRFTGELKTLEYLFEFLNAYDFSSDGGELIQEENKSLINAAVLGLIFEKINGYKDGSFFTPGFITMYMSRETIRRAAVQKFNEVKDWKCRDIEDLYNKIEDRHEANNIINSLKICDPAVGSGHFLVSALNEIIALKHDLNILQDRSGRWIKEYNLDVVNDELILTDYNGEIFRYHPNNRESRRLQETLFHEKQTIIENCLFGVDINPNSVKICRLRLWIELLKNAYYLANQNQTGVRELQTLPNIDINIKCGNSLVSRFRLDASLKATLRKSKFGIQGYRLAVMAYKNAHNKEEKREFQKLINTIKNDFQTEITREHPLVKKLSKLESELIYRFTGNFLFEPEAMYGQNDPGDTQKKLEEKIAAAKQELEDQTNSIIFRNAFEWRFEFPEVLSDDGDFLGFDLVIGNPPYGVKFNDIEKAWYAQNYSATDDIYTVFFEKGLSLVKKHSQAAFISPVFWLTGDGYFSTRKFLANSYQLNKAIVLPYDVFTEAYIDTGIFFFQNGQDSKYISLFEFDPKDKINLNRLYAVEFNHFEMSEFRNQPDLKIICNSATRSLIKKLNKHKRKIVNITDSIRGILAELSDYSTQKINSDYKPIFIGKLDRYAIENEIMYVRYGDHLKEKPSDFSFFEGERILIRRIINRRFRIMANITNVTFVNKKDIYVFKSKNSNFPPTMLLAIINSKLISYVKTKGSTSAKKDDFTQLTLNDIREIPIPNVDGKVKKTLIQLVNSILTAKTNTPAADTTALEAEIDKLVYELYGLTAEEIKIVEDSVK